MGGTCCNTLLDWKLSGVCYRHISQQGMLQALAELDKAMPQAASAQW